MNNVRTLEVSQKGNTQFSTGVHNFAKCWPIFTDRYVG